MNGFVTELEFEAFGITNGGVEELELAHTLAAAFGDRYRHSASRGLKEEHKVVSARIIPAVSSHELTNKSISVKGSGGLLLIELTNAQFIATETNQNWLQSGVGLLGYHPDVILNLLLELFDVSHQPLYVSVFLVFVHKGHGI